MLELLKYYGDVDTLIVEHNLDGQQANALELDENAYALVPV